MAYPKKKTPQEMRDAVIRASFQKRWRVVLTAEEIYKQRNAAKGKADA